MDNLNRIFDEIKPRIRDLAGILDEDTGTSLVHEAQNHYNPSDLIDVFTFPILVGNHYSEKILGQPEYLSNNFYRKSYAGNKAIDIEEARKSSKITKKYIQWEGDSALPLLRFHIDVRAVYYNGEDHFVLVFKPSLEFWCIDPKDAENIDDLSLLYPKAHKYYGDDEMPFSVTISLDEIDDKQALGDKLFDILTGIAKKYDWPQGVPVVDMARKAIEWNFRDFMTSLYAFIGREIKRK